VTNERLTVLSRLDGDSPPLMFHEIDPHAPQSWIAFEKVLRQQAPERLGLFDRMTRGQRVHRVLHCVGGQHVAIVAIRVGLAVIALEPDGDSDVLQVVPITVA
jgi:hypothetical protein